MGRVVHFEIAADDIVRATKFYRDVFDWDIDETMPNEYWLVKTGSDLQDGINGALMKRQDSVRQGSTKGYVCTIEVEDIEAARWRVNHNGGKLLTEVLPIPGIGKFCYCADTEANSFGMLETAG